MASRELAPEDVLVELTAILRREDSVVSSRVEDPGNVEPTLGIVAGAGRRAATAPGEYALVVEAVREGYLLHYSRSRLVGAADPDLALLAGDYLYALGLERLAALGDLAAVRELSDLISLAAQVHLSGRDSERAEREAAALWLAGATAIGSGSSPDHECAKDALRERKADAVGQLWQGCSATAAKGGLGDELGRAADAIDFAPDLST